MEFFDDPEEAKLRTMQEFFRIWAWSQKERKRTGVNPLYSLMLSVRNTKEARKKAEDKVSDECEEQTIRKGLVLGKTIPMLAQEKQLIAMKVDKIMNDPDLWRGHYRDKEVLAMFYLDDSANPVCCNESVKRFSAKVKIPRWQVKRTLRSALLYFATLYGD